MSSDLQTAFAGWQSRIGWPVNERMRAELAARYGVSGGWDLQTLLSRFFGEGAAAIAMAGAESPSYADIVATDGASHYWKLDELSGTSAVDSIGGATGTISGGVTLGVRSEPSLGTGMTFDGVNGKVQTGNLAIPAPPLTFECWIRTSAVSSNPPVYAITTAQPSYAVRMMGDGTQRLYLSAYDGATIAANTTLLTHGDGRWHHFVWVISATEWTCYTDGVLDPLSLHTTIRPTTGNAATPFYIASSPFADFLPGSIDEVAIYPLALTPAKILNHYHLGLGTYAKAILADTPANYWRLSETAGTTAVDTVGGSNGTISGGVTFGAVAPVGGTGMTFNGSTGQIATSGSPVVIPVVASIEAWCKQVAVGGGGNQVLFSSFTGSTGSGTLALYISGGLVAAYSGITAGVVTGGPSLKDDCWHHVVMITNGASVSLYTDGVLRVTDVFDHSMPSTGNIQIGDDTNIPGTWFQGSIDDVAVYPYALTPAQIAAHYALGAATYAQKVIIDGASNHWPLDETSGTTAVDVIGGKNGTISGGVTLDQAGIAGGKAMTFNGTTGKIVTASDLTLPPVLTIETWFKTSAGGNQPICGPLTYSGSDDTILLIVASGNMQVFIVFVAAATSTLQVTGSFNDGQWHHLAVVFPGGTTALIYVDGVSRTFTGGPLDRPLVGSTGFTFEIGHRDETSWFLNGAVDDVAIYPTALTPAQILAHYQAGIE